MAVRRPRGGINRQVARFRPAMQAHSGVDPNGSFLEFTKKDTIKNIDMHRDTVKRVDDLNSRIEEPALGVSKRIQGRDFSATSPNGVERTRRHTVSAERTNNIFPTAGN